MKSFLIHVADEELGHIERSAQVHGLDISRYIVHADQRHAELDVSVKAACRMLDDLRAHIPTEVEYIGAITRTLRGGK